MFLLVLFRRVQVPEDEDLFSNSVGLDEQNADTGTTCHGHRVYVVQTELCHESS